jgi:LCP family protein required for cell wall assembly
MGTNKLKRPENGASKTAPLKAQTGKLKKGTQPQDFVGSGFSTGQLRMPPSRRRKTAQLRKVMIALSATAFAGGLAAAVALMGASAFLDGFNADRKGALSARELAQGLVPLSQGEAVLVMGTDIAYAEGKRFAGGATRSDTMMVLGVDPSGGKLQVVSIPRDTRVLVRGRYDKINAAVYQGGPKLAAEVVSDLLGVPVRSWAQVNTTGLEKLIDTVGGVRLYVEKDMRYTDHTAGLEIDIRKGWNVLDGANAHRFVRFRHDELGDIGRVQRQQQFVRAALEQLLRPETLLKLPGMLATVKENVRTNLSGPDLVQLAAWGARLDRQDVHMVMLPGEFSGKEYQASYWLADPIKARELGKTIMGKASQLAGGQPKRGQVRVTVLNGTQRSGLAKSAARELAEAGWDVRAVGDASFRHNGTTKVIAQTGHGEWTGAFGKDLGVSPERVDASVGDIMSDFTIIVGEDYATELGLTASL